MFVYTKTEKDMTITFKTQVFEDGFLGIENLEVEVEANFEPFSKGCTETPDSIAALTELYDIRFDDESIYSFLSASASGAIEEEIIKNFDANAYQVDLDAKKYAHLM